MKNKLNTFIITFSVIILASCSAQNQLSSRLTSEWEVARFEVRTPGGSNSIIENAGSITFRSNGRGAQSFTTAIAHAGQAVDTEFRWKNTANTVTIRTIDAEYPKVWIVVNSGKGKQEWYSTDSSGNVQVMLLEKK
ncbi:MAG: hypothetical protein ABR597_11450 [Bacteroidales bacterium]